MPVGESLSWENFPRDALLQIFEGVAILMEELLSLENLPFDAINSANPCGIQKLRCSFYDGDVFVRSEFCCRAIGVLLLLVIKVLRPF